MNNFGAVIFRRLLIEGTRAKPLGIRERRKIHTEIPTLNLANCREDIIQRITQAAEATGYKILRINSENGETMRSRLLVSRKEHSGFIHQIPN